MSTQNPNNFQNLRVTALLSSPIAVFDDYSPSLDALLEWLWLDERGLVSSNPDPDNLIQADLPVLKGYLGEEWYWCVSSPHYLLEREQTTKFRKRWDYQDKHCNWGKRKAKFSTSEGHAKSYDLPLYLRTISQIDWFCVGDRAQVKNLLERCTHIGKKRSYGYGEIQSWKVEEFPHDWHLSRHGYLARPVPTELLFNHWGIPADEKVTCLEWGWRPPGWLAENKKVCAMPSTNVKRDA